MCKNICDTTSCTNHDMWFCKCNYVCFRCRQSVVYGGNYGGVYPWDALRKKYVCFDCKHIWKHRWTKIYHETDEGRIRCSVKNFKNEYYDNKPGCNKCGKTGINVGENFRHCKTNKEWEQLKKSYLSGEINMVENFEGSAVRPKFNPHSSIWHISETENPCSVIKFHYKDPL